MMNISWRKMYLVDKAMIQTILYYQNTPDVFIMIYYNFVINMYILKDRTVSMYLT